MTILETQGLAARNAARVLAVAGTAAKRRRRGCAPPSLTGSL